MIQDELLQLDAQHVWHPYSAIGQSSVFPVASAQGVTIQLMDGTQLIDGMSSWWCAIHGYQHPVLDQALIKQTKKMSHVMFGGLTHEPAVTLAKKLVDMTPKGLTKVFFTDSGSVSVEVAMKLALQYWQSKQQPKKSRFISLLGGYHGDTFGAMSVCDPVTGMHGLFKDQLSLQLFAPKPNVGFHDTCTDDDLLPMKQLLEAHHLQIAGIILEPIVQGAGGMNMYSPDYLARVRQLADTYDVLLIADEIATGFGRTGKLFACEHAGISPDILCIGKSLTGGYLTLAATLTTDHISEVIAQEKPHVFMHGPTYMANPLACAVALASIDLLLSGSWQQRLMDIEKQLATGLSPCQLLASVAQVRTLGAIGVVEMKQPVDMAEIQPLFIKQGIWVRPFGRLVYIMPAYIINDEDLQTLCQGVCQVLQSLDGQSI